MTSAVAKDPLDALQSLINDVLVQTGKALRASRRDSHGNLPATHMQAKLPDTDSAFHSTLDSLDNEIIRAMSVILRDMNKLKNKKTVEAETSPSLPQPESVEAHSKSAMIIDIDSSPQATTETMPKEEPADNSYVATKPAAPFPDMGMSVPAGPSIIKKNHPPSQSFYVTEAPGPNQPRAEVKHAAPVPLMDANLDNSTSGLTGGHDVVDLISSNLNNSTSNDPKMNNSNMNSSSMNSSSMNNSSMNSSCMNSSNMNSSNMNSSNMNDSNLNFTDMQFTLAPSNTNTNHSSSTGAATAQPNGPSYDFGMFETTNTVTAPTPINNAMSSVTTGTAATTANGTGSAQEPMSMPEPTPVPVENRRNSEAPKKTDGTGTTFSEIFTGDGPADGMDFDFSLGDGNNTSSMGGDTFDDMMNVRDNTFDSMEHGDFDTSFFGLDKADGA
ncbi:hypothetical protein E4U58_003218 [Claviceps cyperi]|nr:hypothetical protein E4U58_003218 [Claviceps cyperi]